MELSRMVRAATTELEQRAMVVTHSVVLRMATHVWAAHLFVLKVQLVRPTEIHAVKVRPAPRPTGLPHVHAQLGTLGMDRLVRRGHRALAVSLSRRPPQQPLTDSVRLSPDATRPSMKLQHPRPRVTVSVTPTQLVLMDKSLRAQRPRQQATEHAAR